MKRGARRRGPRRALIIVQNLPVPLDRRVWQESLALTAAGYEVHVICPRTRECSRRRETRDGVRIYRYRPCIEARRTIAYVLEYAIALASQLFLALAIRFRRRIDVVHVCNPPDLLFLVALPLAAAGASLVFDHHDACPELLLAKGHRASSWQVRVNALFERLTYRFCDVSIETNDSFRDIAIKRGGMSPGDVFVVRSAPDMRRFASAAPDPRWRKGRDYLVAYVGIMNIQDGLDYLIEAAELIIKVWRRRDIQFVLVGAGPELPRLKKRVGEMGIADHVNFTGLISDNHELGSVLASADVCVSPDEANEVNDISTMNKIIEYMAMGKPVVQFDLHEGRVSAGDASLYASQNDASCLAACIVELISDPSKCAEMGRIGQERFLTALRWELQVPKLLAAYARAQGKSRRGSPPAAQDRLPACRSMRVERDAGLGRASDGD